MDSLKRILITGACGDLGEKVCLLFSKQGYDIIGLWNRRAPSDLLLKLPNASFHQVDFSQPIQDSNWDNTFNSIDGLIHIASPKPELGLSHKRSLEDYDLHWNVGVRSVLFLLTKIMKSLLKNNGFLSFVLTSYTLENIPKGLSPYIIQKQALLGLAQSLDAEFSHRGLRIQCFSPRTIDTSFLQDLPEDVREHLIHNIDTLSPEYVASKITQKILEGKGPLNQLI